jgi:nucleoside-diphosphate-sugar epimerase
VRAVVTGAAGFIGSTLCDALLSRGDAVVGVDAFTGYYDPARKRANLPEHPAFELVEADVRAADLVELLEGADAVFHLSAQAGVRLSWAEGFEEYASHNVLATQRLLEACIRAGIPRLVYASSSSVYGQALRYPTAEDDLPAPHSPYGVTKLAGEHLCALYAANWGVPAVALRYFTVYGPRQRPDMAIHRILEAGLDGTRFPLHGDGSAVRDFTFVDDVVAATLAAADGDLEPGVVLNVAGGTEVAMKELLELAAEALGVEIAVEHRPPASGDVDRTGGTTDRAGALLGWAPTVGLVEGLARQAAWHRALRPA